MSERPDAGAYITEFQKQCEVAFLTASMYKLWISVEDRLPEEYQRVLVFVPEANKLIGSPDMDTDRVANGRWVRWDKFVTHWMPLPEFPEVKKG